MQIVTAVRADIPSWLALAAEVEDLFGPLVDDPGFQAALVRNIERGTALCVRAAEGHAGPALAGGLLFSARHLHYEITWLAVEGKSRGRGIGRLLVNSALRAFASPPCTVDVTTFGPDHPGSSARHFYEELGFEPTGQPIEGGSRQVYRLRLPRT
ncbi:MULTISPECIES: GNAT family N-acetyltransferase [unclassified Kitasatospora]|uniref:GNAT family N-acetyltransferase n=1 Tax=unclassified Kitasatospora TaxID=2633591 RepID=UPI0033E40148